MRVQQSCQRLFSEATSLMRNNFRVRVVFPARIPARTVLMCWYSNIMLHVIADNVLPIAEPKEVEEEIQDVLSLAKVDHLESPPSHVNINFLGHKNH